MTDISPDTQQMLECLTQVAKETLERKRQLGHYVVIWQDGRPVAIGEDAPEDITVPVASTARKELQEVSSMERIPVSVAEILKALPQLSASERLAIAEAALQWNEGDRAKLRESEMQSEPQSKTTVFP